jgi:hypothetical protein
LHTGSAAPKLASGKILRHQRGRVFEQLSQAHISIRKNAFDYGAFASASAFYTYVGNDPGDKFDPSGKVAEISGTDENVQHFISEVYDVTGIKLKVVGGKLVQDGKRANIGSKVAAANLEKALGSSKIVTIIASDTHAGSRIVVDDTRPYRQSTPRHSSMTETG